MTVSRTIPAIAPTIIQIINESRVTESPPDYNGRHFHNTYYILGLSFPTLSIGEVLGKFTYKSEIIPPVENVAPLSAKPNHPSLDCKILISP
jgi:hypothetical protein